MSEVKHRNGPRGSRRAAALLGVAMSLLLAGCNSVPTGGKGELEDEFFLTVAVTNIGTGSGTVNVQFSSGTVASPCPATLGPGQSCSPVAGSLFKIESVTLEAIALEDSTFLGWGETCTGIEDVCEIINDSRELDVRFEVTVRFDPAAE